MRVPRKKKPVPIEPPKLSEPEELRTFAGEAEQVSLMTVHPGWQILRRDIDDYRKKIAEYLPYMTPGGKEYNEARILYIASDKLLKMVEDYEVNRKNAVEFLDKLDNPQENITLDIDNS